MVALLIERDGEITEAFSYERPFNESNQHALAEYAPANLRSWCLRTRHDPARKT